MKKQAILSNMFLVLLSFALGAVSTISYQKYLEWHRLNGSPNIVPQQVSAAAVKDFGNALNRVMYEHSLTQEQLAWLVYKNGFQGFFHPLFEKGSVIMGDGYHTIADHENNLIFFGLGAGGESGWQ